MGEENTFAGVGTTCFFCKREDIGTDREKWHEAKLDNIQVRKSIEMPELDTEIIAEERKGFPITFTLDLTPSEEEKQRLIRFHRKMIKFQKGSRHYRRKLLNKMSKKELRHLKYELRKHRIVSDIL